MLLPHSAAHVTTGPVVIDTTALENTLTAVYHALDDHFYSGRRT
jgi:hypothetical protein